MPGAAEIYGPKDMVSRELTLKTTERLSVALYDVLGEKTFTNPLVKE